MGIVTPVNRNRFYNAIMDIFANGKSMTARECSVHLYNMGLAEYPNRQASAPRLVELCKLGRMEVIGSKVDEKTHKVVSIYKLKENE